MKYTKLIAFFLFIFFYGMVVHADVDFNAPYSGCTKNVVDGVLQSVTCKVGFQVTSSPTNYYKYKVKLSVASDFNITNIIKSASTGWYFETADDSLKEYTLVSTANSFPVGTYEMATITFVGGSLSQDCSAGVSVLSRDNTSRICSISKDTSNNTYYYDKNGNLTTGVNYDRQCRPHNCDNVVDSENHVTYYYDKEGHEVTQEQQRIFCDEHLCEEVEDSTTHHVYYFDVGSNQVSALEYYNQCKPHVCKTYTDSNTHTIYYFDADGDSVSESAYHDSCDEKPKCEIKDNKYYDNNGNETDKTTYERICLPHNCDTVEDGSTTYYYDKNGVETDVYTYQRQCSLHNCDRVVDSNHGITYYYDKNGNEINENQYSLVCETHTCEEVYDTSANKYQYFGSSGFIVEPLNYYLQCKEHMCKSYKDINTGTMYYFNNLSENVTQGQFEEACDEKPSCGIVSNKYYDQDGVEVDEITYKKQCTTEYRCKYDEVENKYYGTTSNEITKDEYYSICVRHTCDIYIDTQNKKHYYNDSGVEVTALEQIESCKPLICQTYKVGDTTYYYDQNENRVSQEEYENSCLEKPICREENGKYYNKEGKEVKKEEYESSCKRYACKEVGGKYYDSVGNVVSKDVYSVSCDKKSEVENPNTGEFYPLRILAFLFVIGVALYSFAVKNTKIVRLK